MRKSFSVALVAAVEVQKGGGLRRECSPLTGTLACPLLQ